VRDELDARDKQLSDTVAEIEKFREDQHSLKWEVKDRGNAITTLQTELEKVRGEVVEKEQAIATLKAELEARGDKQLTLFPPEPEPIPSPEPVTISPVTEPTPTPSPEIIKPESTPQPEPNPEPTGTLTRGELVQYILEKFPEAKINGQKVTDAIAGKSKNLPKFEEAYGFKYLGKIDGVNRFQPILKP